MLPVGCSGSVPRSRHMYLQARCVCMLAYRWDRRQVLFERFELVLKVRMLGYSILVPMTH